jgi:hypothetical protein
MAVPVPYESETGVKKNKNVSKTLTAEMVC